MLEPRFRVFSQDDFDYIKAEKDIRIAQQSQPGQPAAGDALLFLTIHRVKRAAEIFAGPGFHLHENKGVAIAADDIDFAAGSPPKITIQDFVILPPQELAGQFLSAAPPPQVLGTRRRKPAAPPARKIADESDKARVHAI